MAKSESQGGNTTQQIALGIAAGYFKKYAGDTKVVVKRTRTKLTKMGIAANRTGNLILLPELNCAISITAGGPQVTTGFEVEVPPRRTTSSEDRARRSAERKTRNVTVSTSQIREYLKEKGIKRLKIVEPETSMKYGSHWMFFPLAGLSEDLATADVSELPDRILARFTQIGFKRPTHYFWVASETAIAIGPLIRLGESSSGPQKI